MGVAVATSIVVESETLLVCGLGLLAIREVGASTV
jgi:hypothetical protein